MINLDDIAGENIKEHNLNWLQIPDHLCRILIVGGSRLKETNALLNLINHQPDIYKIYLYAKDTHEPKHLVSNKCFY